MSLLQHCQVCRKVCRPLRCRQCRNAFYCSINCQKIDWKAGHRRTCSKRPEDKVVHALQELRSIAQTLPLDRAKEHFDKATDVVEKQMEQEKLEKNDSSKSKISKARDRKVDVKQDTKNATKAFTVDQGFLKPKVTATRQPMVPHFLFCAEEMKHISCFQITLRQSKKQSTIPIGDDLDLSSNRTDGSHTLILLREKKSKEIMFAAELPRHLIADQCSWRIEDEYTIQLRLQYEEDPCELYTGVSKCHPAEVINEVHCRYCEQALLPKKNIQRVCQLPEGHWDEIADYLICYNGQPVVDFSASSASPEESVAMQDSNVICLHRRDLCESACVLAVSGYGESEEKSEDEKGMNFLKDAAATVRGERSWRDSTGGAAVCCSQCCSPLGFASIDFPETYRLLKHRLSVGTRLKGLNQLTSCASFVAREMVRYAEAKAIFTFVVGLDSPPQQAFYRKCLLLRLVSWDTNMATNFEDPSPRLSFRRVAKIVFEETNDKLAENNSDGGMKWEWGGVDLCCTPLNFGLANLPIPTSRNTDRKVSTVRLLLQQDEYDEVAQSFREGGSIFSRSVTEATILVKMGVGSSGRGNALGLTAIPLDS